MKLVEHIKEPQRVLVIWQRPDNAAKGGSGDRYVVGEVRREDDRIYLEYYENEETARAHDLGFEGLTAFPYAEKKLYNGSVESVLSKRLASPLRSDYRDYLLSHRLDPTQAEKLSVLGLLAYTGGKLVGDGYSFVHTFDDVTPPFDFTFEIAGFRHNLGMQHFNPLITLNGLEVTFAPEPTNVKDKNAIAVAADGVMLGHVPKGLLETMHSLLAKHKVVGNVARLNGTPERPCVVILVQVRA